jgi:hypothetical protein
MHIVLLALGLVIVAAGVVLIGLGLPTSTGALGHTLVVAGTIAAMGSLILSSLATAMRQLRRIAQALETRPMTRAPATEPDESHVAAPPRSPAVEPRFESGFEPEPETRIEPMVEPLPAPAAHATVSEPAPEVAEPATAVPTEEPPLEPRPEPEKTFEAVWSGGLEPAARTTQAAVTTVGVAVAEAVRPEPALAAPPEPHLVRIFKSGVIDGMAYTLYTDGSIEAELPQGTVKFASIDELRAYLTARE